MNDSFIPKNPKSRATQKTTVLNENDCNTVIIKDDRYINSLHDLSILAESKVKQNNAVEIYGDYFEYEDKKTLERESVLKTISVFADPARGKSTTTRPVSCISWSPNGGEKIAIAYCSPQFLGCLDANSTDGFIFDITNPTKHVHRLHAPSSLTSIQYNPREESQIAGGCHEGHICWWDTRLGRNKGSLISDEAHRDPVYNVIWTNSNTNTELMTASGDGTVKFWDVRKLNRSRDTFIIDNENEDIQSKGNILNAYGASCLEYDTTIPTKYMIGTEQGAISCCSRNAKNQTETITAEYKGHYGPIRCLQRNPKFTKYFLTIGDWSVKIWADDVFKSPVFWMNCGTELLTDGCWSPIRPSLFFLSKMNGLIEGWDIINKQKEPILSQEIHSGPIHCMAIHEKGALLCAGQEDGSVVMLEVSESLSTVKKEERYTLLHLLDRETRREKVLEGIVREKLLRLKNVKGMKLAITKIRAIGLDKFKKDADKNCASLLVANEAIERAEAKFFESIDAGILKRENAGKPTFPIEKFEC